MSFGDAWKETLGDCDKHTTFEVLDFFHDQGGNFIDTACNYQNEESETWVGDWMKERGVRDEMVIATKFTSPFRTYEGHDKIIHVNYGGNGNKSMRLSLEGSLKKLQTDYVDVLYVHWWDFTTSIEELMLGLNDLVRSGKVLYLGVSDTPAWIVSKANQYARDHGLRQFVVYQGRWNAARRDLEREVIPMCVAEGMGIAPWAALGGGNFKTEEQLKTVKGRNLGGPSEAEAKVSRVLEAVATRKKTAMTSVALAYVMHKAPYVFPICGGRKVDHLRGNIEALGLKLDDNDIEEIENAVDFDVGFPSSFLSSRKGGPRGPEDVSFTKSMGNFDFVERLKPIEPWAAETEA